MDQIRDVAVIVGSLRKDSINRKVANARSSSWRLRGSSSASSKLASCRCIGDENPPAAWTAFHERISASAAVLFVTPEHNRSVPAALKNALDVGSRPYGKSAGAASRVRSSAPRRALSADLAPTTICGSRSFF